MPRPLQPDTSLLRFHGTLAHDPAIDAWFDRQAPDLGPIARHWFQAMRACGDEGRELLHDGHPTACLGDVPFASVNVFTAHVNIAFFQGASLPDPFRLLEGTGRFMRHIKLRPSTPIHPAALQTLITLAYSDIKSRIEHG